MRRHWTLLVVVAAIVIFAQCSMGQQGASGPASPAPLGMEPAFGIGILGALLGYIILYRNTRLEAFAKDPKHNWNVLLFDVVVYLACGGLVTAFLVSPGTIKEAFTGGLAWQGIAGGAMAGTELATYKKAE